MIFKLIMVMVKYVIYCLNSYNLLLDLLSLYKVVNLIYLIKVLEFW